jgi:hypothetical protein
MSLIKYGYTFTEQDDVEDTLFNNNMNKKELKKFKTSVKSKKNKSNQMDKDSVTNVTEGI